MLGLEFGKMDAQRIRIEISAIVHLSAFPVSSVADLFVLPLSCLFQPSLFWGLVFTLEKHPTCTYEVTSVTTPAP